MLTRVVGLDDMFREHYDAADENAVMRFLILDPHNPSSILSCIRHARENTRTFREILPAESWERINGLHLFLQHNVARTTQGRLPRFEVLSEMIERRQSLVGLLMGSMSVDVAYHFIRLGRNIERADMSTRIVDVNSAVLLPKAGLTGPEISRLWMGTLNALSAYQMYRQYVSVHVRGQQVLEFVLKDACFPRTVHSCLNELATGLKALPNHEVPLAAVRHARRRLLHTHFDNRNLPVMHARLDDVEADIGAIHDAVSRQYFQFHDAGDVHIQHLAQA